MEKSSLAIRNFLLKDRKATSLYLLGLVVLTSAGIGGSFCSFEAPRSAMIATLVMELFAIGCGLILPLSKMREKQRAARQVIDRISMMRFWTFVVIYPAMVSTLEVIGLLWYNTSLAEVILVEMVVIGTVLLGKALKIHKGLKKLIE